MPLLRYALRRIGQTLPVALLVTVMIFFLIKLLPGDPATAVLGDRASVQAVQALHKQWGLDRPLPVQYAVYMRKLVTGDLGQSLRYRTPVMDLLPRRAGVTALGVGWRYWSTSSTESTTVSAIADAKREETRLAEVLKQVADFDEQRAELQRRVTLIDELRRGQNAPVHLVDEISRALPEMTWLTSLK